MTDKAKLLERATELEVKASRVEGDSDNPLRVAAANRLYEEVRSLRAQAAKEQSHG